MLDAYEKLWIHFFQYKFHQEKSLLKGLVSVIIIIIFKSKIEDSFIFITIFFMQVTSYCYKIHVVFHLFIKRTKKSPHLQRHNGLQRHYQIMKERHSSPKFNMETDGNWLVAATSK